MRFLVPAVLAAVVIAPLVAAPAQAAAPAVRFSYAQYDSPGKDTRTNAQINREYVVVKNFGKTTRNLTGWTVRDLTGYKFTFPAFTLKAGKTVTIRTGRGTGTAATRYFGYRSYVWNNTSDTATLKNKAGKKIDTCSWTTRDDGAVRC